MHSLLSRSDENTPSLESMHRKDLLPLIPRLWWPPSATWGSVTLSGAWWHDVGEASFWKTKGSRLHLILGIRSEAEEASSCLYCTVWHCTVLCSAGVLLGQLGRVYGHCAPTYPEAHVVGRPGPNAEEHCTGNISNSNPIGVPPRAKRHLLLGFACCGP